MRPIEVSFEELLDELDNLDEKKATKSSKFDGYSESYYIEDEDKYSDLIDSVEKKHKREYPEDFKEYDLEM